MAMFRFMKKEYAEREFLTAEWGKNRISIWPLSRHIELSEMKPYPWPFRIKAKSSKDGDEKMDIRPCFSIICIPAYRARGYLCPEEETFL